MKNPEPIENRVGGWQKPTLSMRDLLQEFRAKEGEREREDFVIELITALIVANYRKTS
jgi:hypothetical protein